MYFSRTSHLPQKNQLHFIYFPQTEFNANQRYVDLYPGCLSRNFQQKQPPQQTAFTTPHGPNFAILHLTCSFYRTFSSPSSSNLLERNMPNDPKQCKSENQQLIVNNMVPYLLKEERHFNYIFSNVPRKQDNKVKYFVLFFPITRIYCSSAGNVRSF